MGFVRDAALARKYATAHPEHMVFALRVAALREQAAEWLRRPRTLTGAAVEKILLEALGGTDPGKPPVQP
jgi:hypothetical protein